MNKKYDTCTYNNCNKLHKARGYCSTHYTRFLRHGDPNIRKRERIPKGAICEVTECENSMFSKRMCRKHYARFRKHGTTILQKHPKRFCKIENCDKKYVAKGYCHSHYERFRRHGDPLAGRPFYKPRAGLCDVSNCNQEIYVRGVCWGHYVIWNKHDIDPHEPVTCYICSKRYESWPSNRTMSLDHVIPKSKGGLDNKENMKPACFSCNRRKGNDTLEELLTWCKSIILIHEHAEKIF